MASKRRRIAVSSDDDDERPSAPACAAVAAPAAQDPKPPPASDSPPRAAPPASASEAAASAPASGTRKRCKRAEAEVEAETDGRAGHTHAFSAEETALVRRRLLDWYDAGHRALPWRRDGEASGDGYGVWVSEVMLQQTRVDTVRSYYERWMQRFPTVEALAAASLDEVNAQWQGLGFYARARRLHEGARQLVSQSAGRLPTSAAELQRVPGIGPYTAGAIASIAFGERAPIVDGNVVRVLSRLRAIGADPTAAASKKLHWQLADALVDERRPGAFNQALMDLGSTVCTPTAPRCGDCPLAAVCWARRRVTGTAATRAAGGALSDEAACFLCGDFAFDASLPSVEVLPAKAPKTKQRPLTTAVAIVERTAGSEFLLVQRPASGLLASLWEFPAVDFEDEPPAAERLRAALREHLSAALGVRTEGAGTALGQLTHLFSHIRQTLHVFRFRLSGAQPATASSQQRAEWLPEKRFGEVALSTGVRKCFALLRQRPAGRPLESYFTRKPAAAAKEETLVESDAE